MGENNKTSSSSFNKDRKVKIVIGSLLIALNLILAVFGYYMLEVVSIKEHAPLGTTFAVIVGCMLMSGSGLLIYFTIKKYFISKKRKKSNPIFLDDQLMEQYRSKGHSGDATPN